MIFERLSSQEIVDNARAATGARLVVLVRFDAARQEARVEAWSAPRVAVLRRALAAAARVDPQFDPGQVAVKADVNRWARVLYLEGQAVAAPFEEIARGTVDARIVHVASAVAGLRYGLLFPLRIGTGVAGSLGFYTPEAPTDAQRRTAQAFSRQAALTLENAYLLAAERRQQEIGHALHAAALAIAAPVPDDSAATAALLATIVERAAAAVGARDGWLTLMDDPAWDHLAPGAGGGGVPESHIRLEHSGQVRRVEWRAQGVTRHVLATGELINEPDTRAPARFGPYPDLVHRGIASRVTVPLRAGGRVLGALAVNFAQPGGLRYEDREPLELFAAHAAAALERLRLAHAERRLSRAVQEAAHGREVFVTAAAHDLKNPLSTIKGRAQHLRRLAQSFAPDQVAAEPGGRLGAGLAGIEEAADRMAILLNQLLDTVRLQTGQPLELVVHPTDLVAMARAVTASYQAATDRHQLVVATALPELFGAWDDFRLERVLENLLSNAIKYSPGGGEITVRVAREDAWAVLTVQDPGLGIAASDRTRIFERFGRGENVMGKIPGTGIGLAGVRQIVEQHGGTVAVDSHEGAGSIFTVRLPLGSP